MRAWNTNHRTDKGTDDEHAIEGFAFAKLVMFIEEVLIDDNMALVFKLADLAQFYASRMKQLGIMNDSRFFYIIQRISVNYYDN